MTQQQQAILNYLRLRGSITPMQAFADLHITKLATRIGEMKNQGIGIDRVMISDINTYGTKVRYAQYFLKKENTNV